MCDQECEGRNEGAEEATAVADDTPHAKVLDRRLNRNPTRTIPNVEHLPMPYAATEATGFTRRSTKLRRAPPRKATRPHRNSVVGAVQMSDTVADMRVRPGPTTNRMSKEVSYEFDALRAGGTEMLRREFGCCSRKRSSLGMPCAEPTVLPPCSRRPTPHRRRTNIPAQRQRPQLRSRNLAVFAGQESNASFDLLAQEISFDGGDSDRRVTRLEDLLQLRRLYRNCFRAAYLLQLPSPIYARMRENSNLMLYAGEEREEREAQVTTKTLETIAEMQVTADQLKAGLRMMSVEFASLFPPNEAAAAKSQIESKVGSYAQRLSQRVLAEIPSLPITSKMTVVNKEKLSSLLEKQQKRVKYRRGEDTKAQGAIKRLGKAEKLAEKFVASKLQQVKEMPPEDYLSGLQSSAIYLKELWDRLNGGGASKRRDRLPADLPRPLSTAEASKTNMSHLVIEVEKLEKRVKDASKLKIMDDEVLQLTRLLALRSLQLQMEYVYQTLEEEALDVLEHPTSAGFVPRQGSTEELLLLTAEFSLLEEQLRTLMKRLTQSPTVLVRDTVLQNLVDDIEDLRRRLGINSDVVFGDSRLTWRKVTLKVEQAIETIQEGINFLIRGVRLMGTDLIYASRLFSKAALGGTLKPREVAALRRTAKDVLAFIPFAAILLVPMTPVGHVFVFGFLQRYFPEVFPSQFTNRRQDIMNKYDILRQQLKVAQETASQAEEEEELARASEVVARLTAPISEKQKKRFREALRKMSGDAYETKSREELLMELEEKVTAAEMDTYEMNEGPELR